MSNASRQIARRIAIAKSLKNKPVAEGATERAPRAMPEPIEIQLDLSKSTVVRAMTREGVPYAKFSSPSSRTVLAFGEIAEVAVESLSVDGMAVEQGSTLKIVGIRPFEHRSTMINETGDDYAEYGPATRQAA